MKRAPRNIVFSIVTAVLLAVAFTVSLVAMAVYLVVDAIANSRCWLRLRRWWTGGRA